MPTTPGTPQSRRISERTNDTRPLSGHTVVVTRARHQAEELGNLLEVEGARVVYFPTIRILPPRDEAPLRRAAALAAGEEWDGEGPPYHWVVFTSANAVAPFVDALPGPLADGTRILAVGPATARALAGEGLVPDLIPDAHVGEGVLDALEADAAEGLGGRRILLPRAAEARAFLLEGLEERGAEVDVVEAYRNAPERRGGDKMRRLLRAGEISILTFTSSSTVLSFFELVLEPEMAHPGALGGAVVAAIGPVTGTTASELGLPVEIEADPYTVPALVRACVAWAARR